MEEKTNIIVFQDRIGRTVIGTKVGEANDKMLIKNAAVILVAQTETNRQIQVQMIPLLINEFLSDLTRHNGIVWEYSTQDTVRAVEVELDEKLVTQYKRVFNEVVIETPTSAGGAPIIKLFDN